MQSVFRYSGQKYNDALLALGNVRVGTLHDFRNIEHKKGIADAKEGLKWVEHHIPHATNRDGNIHSAAIEAFGFFGNPGGGLMEFKNCNFVQQFNHPDCFIHCTSADYLRSTMDEFEGADSCVEIADVAGFYRRLTESLNKIVPVQLLTVAKVTYMERREDWNGRNWGTYPALIKEPEFSRQGEIRAIWGPKRDSVIKPLVLNDIGLISFCRAVGVPPGVAQ
ncbi:hypothetical protein [Pseudomonas sp. AP3_22 TE3818]